MRILKFSWLALLVSVSSLAQTTTSAPDPAITAINLTPRPIQGGVGTPFSMSFTIGNNGTAPISGQGLINRMAFGICLGKAQLATGNLAADVTGPLLDYFTIGVSPTSGCLEARQKAGVALPAGGVFDLYVSLKVVTASSNPLIDDIGASCNVAPNPTANPQPTTNDFLSLYTHTVAAMPVSLVSFEAQAQADRTVVVKWQTSWEVANKGFVIERSKDLQGFESVGEVRDVAGSSQSLNTYRFVDKSPYGGTSYYRLVQVDVDGSRHTYKAQSVVLEGRYGVYPNPVVGSRFSLELDEPLKAVLHLYSASGQEVGLSRLAGSEQRLELSTISKLSAGVYILTVEERGSLRKHRLVVP